ncbi:MAG: class I SAM-dependent methyltransferase [Candidatus Aenigmarchaeota archaeon]|nr:class I SAM-dependent methyltransferase [Candidatus Aenigmarchaeota archaeon]
MNKSIQNLVKGTYEKIAKEYTEIAYSNKSYKKHLDFLASKLGPKAHILDIGCGPATATRYLAEMGFKCTGIDFSKKQIKIAEKNVPQANFVVKDFTKEKIEGKYDAVISYLSLVYVPKNQLSKLLKKFSKNLKKNGILQIAMLYGKWIGISKDFWGTGEPMYSVAYYKDELRKIVESAGYRIIRIRTDVNKFKGINGETIKEKTIYLTAKI